MVSLVVRLVSVWRFFSHGVEGLHTIIGLGCKDINGLGLKPMLVPWL